MESVHDREPDLGVLAGDPRLDPGIPSAARIGTVPETRLKL
jgi:hypothetical protein